MTHNTKLQSRADISQLENRKKLVKLFESTPIPVDQLLVNLPLYMRSSAIAKFLYVNELYQLIIDTPGVIMEFGVWWGANLAIFESLRAVYEPYNYTRKVIGFDTFKGYASITAKDGVDNLVMTGNYSVNDNYLDHLTELLDYHEQENVMSHIKKYELIEGDVTNTIEEYLVEHPETMIALAYFDLQLYEPTKACLQAIKPFVTRGTVIAMDELNSPEFPGETIAFKEVWGLDKYRIIRSRYLPDRSYLIVD